MKHRKRNNMFFPVFAFVLVTALIYFITQPTLEGLSIAPRPEPAKVYMAMSEPVKVPMTSVTKLREQVKGQGQALAKLKAQMTRRKER